MLQPIHMRLLRGGAVAARRAVGLQQRSASTSAAAALAAPHPPELYGKFTWKIENFSEISKRELRSNVFEVGSYKWCA